MRDLTKATKIFISAERPEVHTSTNKINTRLLQGHLDKLSAEYIPVRGCYEGREEKSFMVMTHSYEDTIKIILELGHLFNQDSILVVCPSNDSFFIDCTTGAEESGGVFTEVGSKPDTDYSEIDGRYFILSSY